MYKLQKKILSYSPEAIEGYDVMELLGLVVPPIGCLGIREVWKHRRSWPNLRISRTYT